MHKLRYTVPALAAALVLTGCSTGTGDEPSPAAANISPGVVTDVGGLGDFGFNDLAQEGMELAEEEFGLSGRVLVPETPADYVNNLTQLAENSAQPIFGVGFALRDSVEAVATEFPDTHFASIDATVDLPNVVSLLFQEEQGSYLAGVLAGLMTSEATPYTNPDDKIVGFIGGQEAPLIEKFGAGFEQGVASVCDDCTVLYQYIGSTGEAFRDPTTAAEIARNMRANGADIIYHAAGGSGVGLFRVATDEQFFAIGVNTDQALTNPDAPILASMLKRVEQAVYQTISAEVAGEFEAGSRIFGLENEGVGMSGFGKYDDIVPESVKTAIADAQNAIIAGDVTVSTSRTAG